MSKMKRVSIAFLVFLLTFSGGFVPKQTLADENPLLDQAMKYHVEKDKGEKLSADLDGFFKEDDDVRIIVELSSKPGIVIASNKNVSYSSLSVSEQGKITDKLVTEQQVVKNNIKSKSITMDYKNSFTVAMNGFSGTVKFKDIPSIEKLPGVKHVYLSNEYEKPDVKVDMITSGDMVTVSELWEMDIKGEGQLVAIIDTGIDFNHKDMVLSDETDPALSETDVAALALRGQYFTEKVPYGYNYYDLNNEVIDKGPDASMHGMHVAGTAGANGDPENGGIRGIAPESQLLAMKVFSNDPIYATTFSDIYLVAIDESIKLGADVINMSLGSTASFYQEESAESVALQNAIDNGIVAAVSAGNSGNITYGWADTYQGLPWRSNPDVGVVGAPGLNAPTISVASIENTNQQARYLTYAEGDTLNKVPMALAGPTDPTVLPANVEYAFGGLGKPEELNAVDGKVALISRGALAFTDKITNAFNAGAIGVIIYNSQAGGEELLSMQYPAGLTIPTVAIGYSDGVKLGQLADKVITFEAGILQVPNPAGGLMSDFSSWGTTPTLEMKPELTAPGGQIYSTLNNNKYGVMSGTSMAAPHVAGGSALVMQYVESNPKFVGLSKKEKSEMVKILLMNTATSVTDELDYDISPRLQGAGLMNLFGAVTTPVTLTNSSTGESKVELKEISSKSFTLKLTARNYSDEALTYAVDTTVLEEYVETIDDVPVTGFGSDYVDHQVVAPDTITIPANGKKSFEVTVDFSEDETLVKNMFVEGFVRLVDEASDMQSTVSIPYVGFYGDWAEPAIIDGLITSDAFGPSYFQFSGFGLLDEYGDLGFNFAENIFINPTYIGQYFGTDNVLPILSFLRNAEEVNYNITDAEGNLIRTLNLSQWQTKNFINGGRNNEFTISLDNLWDGTAAGEAVADGNYIYEIKAKVQGQDEYQTYTMPVGVDTTAPELEFTDYDPTTRNVTFRSTDDGAGLEFFMVAINGDFLANDIMAVEGQDTYTFTLPQDTPEIATIKVVAVDKVYNMTDTDLNIPSDEDPVIYILEPMLLNIYDTSTVHVEGYVTNLNFLDQVLINDSVKANVVFEAEAEVIHPDTGEVIYSGPAFKYTADVELPDGYQEMSIKAISKTGSAGSLVRRFYVDTTAPVMTAEVLDRDYDADQATIRFTLSDNLGYLTLLEDDSQIFKYQAELVNNGQTEKTFDYTVDLVDGENSFNFILKDGAGHMAEETVTIVREELPSISYRGHVRNIGWQEPVMDGQIIGTTGQSLRLEALEIEILDKPNLGVKYSAHLKNIGWTDYAADGEMVGTVGESRRIEAVKIELTGIDADKYDIYYSAHIRNYGWLGWAKNGEAAGSEGMSLRMEAMKIKVVQKGRVAPGSMADHFYID